MELLTPLYYNFVITADKSPALQGGDGEKASKIGVSMVRPIAGADDPRRLPG
jgi:hypothetical protein